MTRTSQLLLSIVLIASTAGVGARPGAAPQRTGTPLDFAARVPLDFVENAGQWPAESRFAARKGAVAASFGDRTVELQLGGTQHVTLTFEQSSARAVLLGEEKRRTVYNYFSGADRRRWRAGVPAYASLLYRGLYDDVDVRFRQGEQRLEYDVLVGAHASVGDVVVRVDGSSRLEHSPDGALLVHTPHGVLQQTAPTTYEVLRDGSAKPVAARYRIIDEHRYGFEVERRDASRPLVIDPGLVWSTIIGGTGGESLSAIEPARDGSGDVFISGNTTSPDFGNAPSSANAPRYKGFVARVAAAGDAYAFVTYLGGLQDQTYPGDMAADGAGGVTLVGSTVDLDFPTTVGAYQTTFASPVTGRSEGDGFVTRLNATGGLVFSTYLGGSGHDGAGDVRIDASGSFIVTGTTRSANFPVTTGAYDTTFNAAPAGDATALSEDAFISRLSPDGRQLTYSTFFGGQTYEVISDLAVDARGYVTIAGITTSSQTGRDIPVSADAFDATWNGGEDGFIARFKLDGLGAADLKYSSFLGGINTDNIEGLALDPNNPDLVTVAGWSWVDLFTGPRFPTTAGVFKQNLTPVPPATALFPHSKTGFVTRFRFPVTGPGTLVWSTFIGGNFEDYASDVAVDETGAAVVIGGTRSHDMQTVRGAIDRTLGGVAYGPFDCFVARLSADGAQLQYATFFGGVYEDCGAVDSSHGRLAYLGNSTVAITGMTASGDFPATAGAIRPTIDEHAGNNNVFVARLALQPDDSGDLSVATPLVVGPADGGSFGGSSGVVRLQWQDVADPSGIESYSYEVSTKPDFPPGFTQYKGTTDDTDVYLESLAINTTWFWRVRAADRAGNLGAFSTPRTFVLGASGGTPVVSWVQVYPTTVIGGVTAHGVVQLSAPAPAGGLAVQFRAKDGGGLLLRPMPASVPQTITIPAGAMSGNFAVTTGAVASNVPVSIYATAGNLGAKGGMTVAAAAAVNPTSLSLDPLVVTGGNPSTGTVRLNAPAPAGGVVIPLRASHPAYATVPASVTVPQGAISATFPVTTRSVPFSFDVAIEALGDGGAGMRKLALKTPGARLTSFTLSSSTVTGGANLVGTLTFDTPIPPSPFPATNDALVVLKSTHPAVGLSPIVVVPVGQRTATFNLNVRNVPATTALNVIATYDATTISVPLTVTGSSVQVSSLTLNVSTLTGGQGGVGHVTLTAPAPPGHVLVALSSSNPAISLPADLTVSAGTTTGLFSFGALPVQATTPAAITAAFGSSTATANVTVNPSSASNLVVTGLTLNPETVSGGGSSVGTVTLNAAAPASGVTVQLSGLSPASVPASVTVPAGSTSATFPIATSSVTTSQRALVYALLNVSWVAALTVTPGTATTPGTPTLLSPANGATVAQPVTVDWSDVSAAATYRVQIDDSSSFSSPVIVDQTVTASQLTAPALTANRTHWWRVRGISASGVLGAWSGGRSFTTQSAPATATLSSITLSTASVVGGTSLTGTARLTSAAPAGGANVTLSSNNAAASVPASATIAAGATTATFAIATTSVGSSTPVTISGTYAGLTRTAALTVTPSSPPGVAVTLSVTASGRNGERVTSSPAGINVSVGSSGSAPFTSGTRITLSVTNGRDAVWSGACSSGGNKTRTCSFTINANAAVSANVQ